MKEELADLCHRQWSGWMQYLFNKCRPVIGDGQSVIIPSEFVERWQRQMNTPYAELSEAEQNSDRLEADKFIEIFEQADRYEVLKLLGWLDES